MSSSQIYGSKAPDSEISGASHACITKSAGQISVDPNAPYEAEDAEDWWWETQEMDEVDTFSEISRKAITTEVEENLSSSLRGVFNSSTLHRRLPSSQEYMRSVSQLLEEMVRSTSFFSDEERIDRWNKQSAIEWLMQSVRLLIYEFSEVSLSSSKERLNVSSVFTTGNAPDAEVGFSPHILLSTMWQAIASIRKGFLDVLQSDDELHKKGVPQKVLERDSVATGIRIEEEISYSLQVYFHFCLAPLIWLWLLVESEKPSSHDQEGCIHFVSSHGAPARVLMSGFQRLLSAECLRSACLFPVGGPNARSMASRRFLCFLRRAHTQGCLSHCTLEWRETAEMEAPLTENGEGDLQRSSPFTMVSSFSSLCVGVSDLVISYMIVLFRSLLVEFSSGSVSRSGAWTSSGSPPRCSSEHKITLGEDFSSSVVLSDSFITAHRSRLRKNIMHHIIDPLIRETWLTVLYITTSFGSFPMLYQREYDRLGHQDAVEKKVSDAIRQIMKELKHHEVYNNEAVDRRQMAGNNAEEMQNGAGEIFCSPPRAALVSNTASSHTRVMPCGSSGGAESAMRLTMVVKQAFPGSCAQLDLHHQEILRLQQKIARTLSPSLSMGRETFKTKEEVRQPEFDLVGGLREELHNEEVLRETISSSLVSSAVLDIGMTESMWWFLKAFILHLKVEWARNERGVLSFAAGRGHAALWAREQQPRPTEEGHSPSSCSGAEEKRESKIESGMNSSSSSVSLEEEVRTQGENKAEWVSRLEVISRRHLLFEGVVLFLHGLEERLHQYQRHRQYLLPLTLALREKQKQSRLNNLYFSQERSCARNLSKAQSSMVDCGSRIQGGVSSSGYASSLQSSLKDDIGTTSRTDAPPHSFSKDPAISPLTTVADRIRDVFHHIYHSSFVSQHIEWEDVLRVHNSRLNRDFFWNCIGVRHLYRMLLSSSSSVHGHFASSVGEECGPAGEDGKKKILTDNSVSEYLLSEVEHILSEGNIEHSSYSLGGGEKQNMGVLSTEMEWTTATNTVEQPSLSAVKEVMARWSSDLSRIWSMVEGCHQHLTLLQATSEGLRSADASSSIFFPSSKRRLERSTRFVGGGFIPTRLRIGVSHQSPLETSARSACTPFMQSKHEPSPHTQKWCRCTPASCSAISVDSLRAVSSFPSHSPEAFAEGLDHSLQKCSAYIGGMESYSEHWCGTVLGVAGETPHDHHVASSFSCVSPAVQLFLKGVQAQPHIYATTLRHFRSEQRQNTWRSSDPLGSCSLLPSASTVVSTTVEPVHAHDHEDRCCTWSPYRPHKHFLSSLFYLLYHPSCFVALQEHLRLPHQDHLKNLLSSLKSVLYPFPLHRIQGCSPPSSGLPFSSGFMAGSPEMQETDTLNPWWNLEVEWIKFLLQDGTLHLRRNGDSGKRRREVQEGFAKQECTETTREVKDHGAVSPPISELESKAVHIAEQKIEEETPNTGPKKVMGEPRDEKDWPMSGTLTPVKTTLDKKEKRENRGGVTEKSEEVGVDEDEEDWWDFQGDELEDETEAPVGTLLSQPHLPPSNREEEKIEVKRERSDDRIEETKVLTGGVLTASGVAAALLGQDAHVIFFLCHSFLSLLPPVNKGTSESWTSLEKRSKEKQASIALKNQVEISNSLLVPLLVRVTTPLPQLLHYVFSSPSSSASFQRGLSAFQDKKVGKAGETTMQASFSSCSRILPFASAFLLLCLRASGMFQLPWNVGETLLVLYRFQSLCTYLLSSQRPEWQEGGSKATPSAVARSDGPVMFSSTPSTEDHAECHNGALLGGHPRRKRQRTDKGNEDRNGFEEREATRNRTGRDIAPHPVHSCRTLPRDRPGPFSSGASYFSSPHRWCLSRDRQEEILQQLGWDFYNEDIVVKNEPGNDGNKDEEEKTWIASSYYGSSRENVEENLPLTEIDKQNAREHPLLMAVLQARAEKQSENLFLGIEEEEDIVDGWNVEEEDRAEKKVELFSFIGIRAEENEEVVDRDVGDGEGVDRRGLRKDARVSRGKRSVLKAGSGGEYYRTLLTAIDGGANPSTHWAFESALLIPLAMLTTHLPPSPCGVLMVMSMYRTISSIFLKQRKEWTEACQNKEEEEELWGSGTARGSTHGPSACTSVSGSGGGMTLGRSLEGRDASSFPPFCAAEDVTVLLVHIRVLHRMLFTYNLQSFLPMLFSKSVAGGSSERRPSKAGIHKERTTATLSSLFTEIIFGVKKNRDDEGLPISDSWSKSKEDTMGGFPFPFNHNISNNDSKHHQCNDTDTSLHSVRMSSDSSGKNRTGVPVSKAHTPSATTCNEITASTLRLLVMLGRNGEEVDGSDICFQASPDEEVEPAYPNDLPPCEERIPIPMCCVRGGHRQEWNRENFCLSSAQGQHLSSCSSGLPCCSNVSRGHVGENRNYRSDHSNHMHRRNFSLFQLWLAYLEHFCRVILPPAGEEDAQMLSVLPSSQRLSTIWTPLSSRVFSSICSATSPSSEKGPDSCCMSSDEGQSGNDDENCRCCVPLTVGCEGWRALTWPIPGAGYTPSTFSSFDSSSSFSSCSSLLSMPTQIRILLGEALADLVVAVLEEVGSIMCSASESDDDKSAAEMKGRGKRILFPPPPPLSPPFVDHFLPPSTIPRDTECFSTPPSRHCKKGSFARLSGALQFSEDSIRLFHPYSSSRRPPFLFSCASSSKLEEKFFIEDIEIEHLSLRNVEIETDACTEHWESRRRNSQKAAGYGIKKEKGSASPPFLPAETSDQRSFDGEDDLKDVDDTPEKEELQASCQSIPRLVLKELCTSFLLPLPSPSSFSGASDGPYAVYTQPDTTHYGNRRRDNSQVFFASSSRKHEDQNEEKKPRSDTCDGNNARQLLFWSCEDAAEACWLGVHGLVSFLRRLESRIRPGTIEDPLIGFFLSQLWELADALALERER